MVISFLFKLKMTSFVIIIACLILGCGSEEEYYTVTTAAMEPTIALDEVVPVNRQYESIQRWDVIVFEAWDNPEVLYISRVVGLPGERVEFHDRTPVIDGEQLHQLIDIQYDHPEDFRSVPGIDPITHPYRVPADAYYVLGDNTNEALDSRFNGAVPQTKIVGTIQSRTATRHYEGGPLDGDSDVESSP